MCYFVEGPLVTIAVIIFILGLLYQGIQFFRLTKKKEWGTPPSSIEIKREKKTITQQISEALSALNGTLWKTDPVLTIITSVFHICLIVAPLFLLGHNILLDQSWGVSLFSLPEFLSNILTIVVLICGVYFLSRRLFLARVRAITTAYDYLVLLIALAPFLTGFFAYQQWLNYQTMIFLHILSGELMLITIPFTKLGHMLFFFLYRFFIGSEYSFVRGSRTW